MTRALRVPDAFGESDDAFFRLRPGINARTRMAFEGELTFDVIALARGRAVIMQVTIDRDRDGNPGPRVRAVLFGEHGGRA